MLEEHDVPRHQVRCREADDLVDGEVPRLDREEGAERRVDDDRRAVVDLERLTLVGFLEIVASITIVLPVVLGGYVLLADRARAIFRSERAIRRINRGTGAAMACAAVAVATR